MTTEELDEIYNEEDSLANSEEVKEEAGEDTKLHKITNIQSMFKNWWLDYASYVVLQRAVPDLIDGFKPVQRRIMHSMWELEDGRYNKVANIIGNTMKYHPHGDRSIGDAITQLGQKELLIDMQGNWGNVLTGDSAAAPRYIEARLSKFALDVVYNPKTTPWKQSYDGRNKEPISLPVKFPLLLAQGVEGIAVGLASKIMPHNFNELIDASIAHLQNKPFELFPDFQTGGLIDVTRYNDGVRGGKVRVRAKISILDKKTLVIKEIPFSTNTSTLIDTIIQANEKGKIKIRKIDDNTAENVEILIHLVPNISPDQTIDALYAFTNCEISISPNTCVIDNNLPIFPSITELLITSTEHTVRLLKSELDIRLHELEENWHFSSLEKIFIENRIYNLIEECETWESVIETIDKGLDPFKKIFKREITREDIIRLTEIKIKRISKFDGFKADELIRNLESEMEEVLNHLANLIDYAINYYRQIKKKHGKGRERKTEIRNFENIEAQLVAVANQKLYVNREEGFVGFSLKKDEFVCDCSDIDDMIVFRADGKFIVTKVSDKCFVGQNIIHVDIFKKNDDRTVYHLIYTDGAYGNVMAKRFSTGGITRDKEYDLTKGTKGSKVLYFSANPNGEAEKIKVFLKPKPKLKKLSFEFNFGGLSVKNRNSMGNILSRNPVKRIDLLEKGVSTLSALEVWYDETIMRLNTESRGKSLGLFKGKNSILTIYKSGYYQTKKVDIALHFADDLLVIEKYNPNKPITILYQEVDSSKYFIKRFLPEFSDKRVDFFSNLSNINILYITNDYLPVIELKSKNKKGEVSIETIEIATLAELMSIKAKGKRLTYDTIKTVTALESLPFEEPEEIDDEEEEITNEDPEIEELWMNASNSVEPIIPKILDDDEPVQMTLF
jgi:topoisomerase IV subunit A